MDSGCEHDCVFCIYCNGTGQVSQETALRQLLDTTKALVKCTSPHCDTSGCDDCMGTKSVPNPDAARRLRWYAWWTRDVRLGRVAGVRRRTPPVRDRLGGML